MTEFQIKYRLVHAYTRQPWIGELSREPAFQNETAESRQSILTVEPYVWEEWLELVEAPSAWTPRYVDVSGGPLTAEQIRRVSRAMDHWRPS